MLFVIEAITNTALSHPEPCDCTVCRAASGDEDALAECIAQLSTTKRSDEKVCLDCGWRGQRSIHAEDSELCPRCASMEVVPVLFTKRSDYG